MSRSSAPTASASHSHRGLCYLRATRRSVMKWEDRGRSRNLEDRRAAGPARMGLPLGIGGVLLVLAISAITGIDLSGLLGIGPSSQVGAPVSQEELNAEEEQVRFVSRSEERRVGQEWS